MNLALESDTKTIVAQATVVPNPHQKRVSQPADGDVYTRPIKIHPPEYFQVEVVVENTKEVKPKVPSSSHVPYIDIAASFRQVDTHALQVSELSRKV